MGRGGTKVVTDAVVGGAVPSVAIAASTSIVIAGGAELSRAIDRLVHLRGIDGAAVDGLDVLVDDGLHHVLVWLDDFDGLHIGRRADQRRVHVRLTRVLVTATVCRRVGLMATATVCRRVSLVATATVCRRIVVRRSIACRGVEVCPVGRSSGLGGGTAAARRSTAQEAKREHGQDQGVGDLHLHFAVVPCCSAN